MLYLMDFQHNFLIRFKKNQVAGIKLDTLGFKTLTNTPHTPTICARFRRFL